MSSSGATYVKTAGEGPVPQWHGVYLGYIAVNQDPTAQGRVKLRVPQVFGSVTSGWAAPAVPLTYIPKVGTAAYVMFAGGDPSQPVWFGNFALPDAASGIVFSATEPSDPTIGEVWVNTTDGLMSEWNGAGWVAYQIGGGAVQSGIGLSEPNITGGTITGAKFVGTNWIEELAGSFYYSGSPAAGNLVSSISAFIGDDDFGNYFLPGYMNYVPAGGGGYVAVQVDAGTIDFYFAANMVSGTNPWSALGNIAAFNGTPNFLQISAGPNIGDYIGLAGPVKVTGGFHYSGPITAYAPGGTTDETWHSLGAPLNGATPPGCTLQQGRYRMTPDGECEIDIALVAAGAGGSGSTAGTYTFANTLPGSYQFPGNYLRVYDLSFNTNITSGAENSIVAVDGNGTGSPGRVRITIPALASGVCLTCTCRIPLN